MMAEIKISFLFECAKCEAELLVDDGDIEWNILRDRYEVKVPLCKDCLEEAKDAAKEEGRQEVIAENDIEDDY
jgi:hypothetical protein